MTKQVWLNLPVKDVNKSQEFFEKLGFSFSTTYQSPGVSAGLQMGEHKFIVMLFKDSVFKEFVKTEITDVNKSCEQIVSFDAESREEVDEYARKVEAAGGKLFAKPAEIQGWMYGCAFQDLDGHRWNVLHMDMSKMPK